MDFQQMKSIIEGLLLVAGDEGLNVRQLAEIVVADESIAEEAVNELASDYREQKRGMQIVEIAGVYQLTSLPEHAPYLQRLAFSPSRATLSQAALETLAIIAYRQPITRVEIEQLRGVNSDRAVHTLLAKDLVQEVGRSEAIGRPMLFGTTKTFLSYFGLNSIEDLPDAESFLSEQSLDEETRNLFARLDNKQLTFDDLKKQI